MCPGLRSCRGSQASLLSFGITNGAANLKPICSSTGQLALCAFETRGARFIPLDAQPCVRLPGAPQAELHCHCDTLSVFQISSTALGRVSSCLSRAPLRCNPIDSPRLCRDAGGKLVLGISTQIRVGINGAICSISVLVQRPGRMIAWMFAGGGCCA